LTKGDWKLTAIDSARVSVRHQTIAGHTRTSDTGGLQRRRGTPCGVSSACRST